MTSREFLTERRDYFHVSVIPSYRGGGWDVVLRVDGTYYSEADAIGAAEGIRLWMEGLSDVPATGWVWWDGPPELQRQVEA